MDTLEVINKRKSVRNYLKTKVDEKDLKIIAETGKKAPKAGEFHITVVSNEEILKKIDELSLKGMKNSGNDFLIERAETPGYHPLYDTPALIIFSAPDENVYGGLTTSAAAENVVLAAISLDYGTCYLISPTLAFTTPERSELIKTLQIPDNFNPICAVSIGKEGESEDIPSQEEINNINYVK
ncbi:MAG: nitroreductase family protein [Methanobrevibacter sp.]|jgi:nitroreductase|nr:nitroreductase family protein [Methanobrevibacter sp.]